MGEIDLDFQVQISLTKSDYLVSPLLEIHNHYITTREPWVPRLLHTGVIVSWSPSCAHTYIPRLFHSLNTLHIYWSRQPRVFRRLPSLLYFFMFVLLLRCRSLLLFFLFSSTTSTNFSLWFNILAPIPLLREDLQAKQCIPDYYFEKNNLKVYISNIWYCFWNASDNNCKYMDSITWIYNSIHIDSQHICLQVCLIDIYIYIYICNILLHKHAVK